MVDGLVQGSMVSILRCEDAVWPNPWCLVPGGRCDVMDTCHEQHFLYKHGDNQQTVTSSDQSQASIPTSLDQSERSIVSWNQAWDVCPIQWMCYHYPLSPQLQVTIGQWKVTGLLTNCRLNSQQFLHNLAKLRGAGGRVSVHFTACCLSSYCRSGQCSP